ncbi:hypothetical protein CHLRE_12g536050v5 [Chlamydomonas reinhardtii]|uniref:Phospholipid-transporting ATPase n=1 Tax=Chlamydomonas reinhardtii TaxID=3055 RepID=A0A2K3D566_CHLRE|nr:uncharacterized protein CHLRE_12g536050v5 [Chlamydomonas reinhardtii]PNW75666.1 hypothetical protein CHLRE_12g536050v5 [Chlamydomonas reinhardtii]
MGLFRRADGPAVVAEAHRHIPLGSSLDTEEHLPYRGNYASTTKYTLLTYLPKALFEQYRRVANIFFTLMAALSLTPFSPLRPWTCWTPLVLVVGVSMIKEAREDYKRYKQDREVNERPTRVLDRKTGEFVTIPWKALRVGDIVQVCRDEYLPADLVLLSTSSDEGTCYIETMNLDGETNLKIKAAPEETRSLEEADLVGLNAIIDCEGPNSRLYQFTGNLRLRAPLPPTVVAAMAAAQAMAAAAKAAAAAEAGGGEKEKLEQEGPGWGRAAAKSLLANGMEAHAATLKSMASTTVAASEPSRWNFRASQRRASTRVEPPHEYVASLAASAVVLRGCSLRNTTCIYGVVIYAGHDTKIFMNSTEAPSKRSYIERTVDRIILMFFCVLLIWCLISAVYHAWWTNTHFRQHWYMRPDALDADSDPDNPAQTGAVNFFVALLLYSYLVPVSLYVSIEMVKVFQAMVLIAQDRDIYHAETDTPALARTSNLNEELGMVAAVMTDKTGTLTRNVMEFFKCSIAGVPYGAGITEIERSNALRKGQVLDDRERPDAAKFRERFFNFYDDRLMGEAWYSAKDPVTIEMFFRLLAVCHTVIPDGPTDEKSIKYEAESPDEAALVVAAKAFGFFFFKRTNTTITVRERTPRGTTDVEYEVLNILEFNSTRKRMSVVVKEKANEKIIIFCKGADTVIYERLDPNYGPNEDAKQATTRDMEDFGASGLRTLCLSYAEVDRDWYDAWAKEWDAGKKSLDDRESKLAEAAEKIERNLRLLGCTAIEDKLQEGVPDCIRMLALAGIRIWVLTGDKMETAINIGFACSLLTEEMHQHTVTASSARVEELEKAGRRQEAEALAAELVAKQLDKIDLELRQATEAATGAAGKAGGAGAGPKQGGAGPGIGGGMGGDAIDAALIIDGKALSYALSKDLAPLLLRVGLRCKAVVCCRVSPLQKAQVTGLVRSTGSITLAIGDGANDVSMIQRAHIGVGISGQEGMQAVMSADFAIAQFRYLVPLLLVHGQYSYKRITRMINFFFYKNMLFAITLFTYSAFTTFSGSYIYNDTSMTLFNVAFTSATPLLVGMFDRPLGKRAMLRYPQLYRQGIANRDFNAATILGWMFSALLQSGIILVLCLVGCRGTTASADHGIPWSMAEVGVVMFTSIVLTIHLHLTMVEEAWTWVHHLAIWGSVALWYLYLVAFAYFPVSWSLEMWHLFEGIVAPNAQFWLYSLIIPAAALLPNFAFRAVSRLLWPSDEDIIREMQKVERAANSDSSHRAGGAAGAAAGAASEHHALQKHKGGGGLLMAAMGSGSNRVAPEPPASPLGGGARGGGGAGVKSAAAIAVAEGGPGNKSFAVTAVIAAGGDGAGAGGAGGGKGKGGRWSATGQDGVEELDGEEAADDVTAAPPQPPPGALTGTRSSRDGNPNGFRVVGNKGPGSTMHSASGNGSRAASRAGPSPFAAALAPPPPGATSNTSGLDELTLVSADGGGIDGADGGADGRESPLLGSFAPSPTRSVAGPSVGHIPIAGRSRTAGLPTVGSSTSLVGGAGGVLAGNGHHSQRFAHQAHLPHAALASSISTPVLGEDGGRNNSGTGRAAAGAGAGVGPGSSATASPRTQAAVARGQAGTMGSRGGGGGGEMQPTASMSGGRMVVGQASGQTGDSASGVREVSTLSRASSSSVQG